MRRKLLADHGEAGKTSNDYIADVLKTMGWKVQLTEREEAEERFEEEFEDILHFKTLPDAEVSLTRLDELMRRFRSMENRQPCNAFWRLPGSGKRRAEMISHNRKVEAQKREEKQEIAEWFRIWLETPDAFFDWLEVRKASPEFREKFGAARGGVALGLGNERARTASLFSRRPGLGTRRQHQSRRTGTSGNGKPRAFTRERSSANLGCRLSRSRRQGNASPRFFQPHRART